MRFMPRLGHSSMKRVSPLRLLIGGLLLLTSCSQGDLLGGDRDVLYRDSFSTPNSGWVRYGDELYTADYVDGAYQIEIDAPNYEAWSVPGFKFTDVRIDVKVSKTMGPDDNIFGVICRYNQPNDFYFFLISSDGYAGIGLYKDGERTLLTGEKMLPGEGIKMGTATNELSVECVGEELKLTVNQIEVYAVQSSALSSGDVGLIAGTYDHAGVVVTFDDFSVRQP